MFGQLVLKMSFQTEQLCHQSPPWSCCSKGTVAWQTLTVPYVLRSMVCLGSIRIPPALLTRPYRLSPSLTLVFIACMAAVRLLSEQTSSCTKSSLVWMFSPRSPTSCWIEAWPSRRCEVSVREVWQQLGHDGKSYYILAYAFVSSRHKYHLPHVCYDGVDVFWPGPSCNAWVQYSWMLLALSPTR